MARLPKKGKKENPQKKKGKNVPLPINPSES
jgi:hypothetical protein